VVSEALDAAESCENREIVLESDVDLGGEERIGGQAGIASNFLAKNGHGVAFYTPFLSGELAEMMDEKVLFPVNEGRFELKNVRDVTNTDRTKRNIIVEYERDCTGRVIFSRKMKGFGPYFRKGVEENFDQIAENFDCAFFAGLHDVDGNAEARLERSREQIEALDLPVHVEYVHREGLAEQIVERVLGAAESAGLDEEEALQVAEILGMDFDQLSLGHAFQLAREMFDQLGLNRVHVHTIRYHAVFSDREKDPDQIRQSMLYGELAAIASAEYGEIPSREQIEQLEFEDIHVHRMDEIEHFDSHVEGDLLSRGFGEIDGVTAVAIPTLIHEEPERLVGLGDIISSGTWAAENR
jgi:ADP-dependent phosphofructokinase/glucokinase